MYIPIKTKYLFTMFEYELFIILSYALLGAGIKYIDQAYDIGTFNKKKANFVAVPVGILMAYLIILDSPSTTIFFSIFVIVALTKKIDNPAFYIGTGILLILPIIFYTVMEIKWLPFGILIFSGIIDEIGNDWADKRIKKKNLNNFSNMGNSLIHNIGEKFFLHRFVMKLAILLLVILSLFSWAYLLAFLLFDLMYLFVEQYSFNIKVYSISKPVMG